MTIPASFWLFGALLSAFTGGGLFVVTVVEIRVGGRFGWALFLMALCGLNVLIGVSHL